MFSEVTKSSLLWILEKLDGYSSSFYMCVSNINILSSPLSILVSFTTLGSFYGRTFNFLHIWGGVTGEESGQRRCNHRIVWRRPRCNLLFMVTLQIVFLKSCHAREMSSNSIFMVCRNVTFGHLGEHVDCICQVKPSLRLCVVFVWFLGCLKKKKKKKKTCSWV